MHMNRTALALAVTAAVGTVAALPARAGLIFTNSYTFTTSGSVEDEQPSGTASTTTLTGSTSVGQFNAGLGVLTGSTLQLDSTLTQTLSGEFTASAGSATKTATGNGTSSASFSAPGAASQIFSGSINGDCSGAKNAGCYYGVDPLITNATNATNAGTILTPGNLDSYVGGGTVTVDHNATLTATSGGTASSTTTKYGTTWNGGFDVSYDYLLHAAPSFDGGSGLLTLDLDFGTVFQGDTASLTFDIFNLFDTDRIGLDLDSISFLSGSDLFGFGGLFTGLAAGSSQSVEVDWNTLGLDPGGFSGSYLLNLSDADIGAAASRWNYSMTLNLMGSVVDGQSITSVPEPGMLALFGIGLLGLGATRLRARRTTPVADSG